MKHNITAEQLAYEVHEYDLQLCDDGDDEGGVRSFWIGTIEDASVGIYSFPCSPAFSKISQLANWWFANKEKVFNWTDCGCKESNRPW